MIADRQTYTHTHARTHAHTHTHKHTHAHHNTPLPYKGRSNDCNKLTSVLFLYSVWIQSKYRTVINSATSLKCCWKIYTVPATKAMTIVLSYVIQWANNSKMQKIELTIDVGPATFTVVARAAWRLLRLSNEWHPCHCQLLNPAGTAHWRMRRHDDAILASRRRGWRWCDDARVPI